MDSDIIVNKDLSELFDIDIEECYAGVIQDLIAEERNENMPLGLKNYFNSGVMLLNLDLIRRNDIKNRLIETKKQIVTRYQDQDIFNLVFKENIKILPIKYNFLQTYAYKVTLYKLINSNFNKLKKDIVILHLTCNKPWNYSDIETHKEFMKYYKISPYRNKSLNTKKLFNKTNKITLANIFSVKNKISGNKFYKVWTILGFKLSIRNLKKELEEKEVEKQNELESCAKKINEIIGKSNALYNNVLIHNFLSHNIKENSVLFIELNNAHGECLPGMAKYFIDLGFHVDILLSETEYDIMPFAKFDIANVDLFKCNNNIIHNILNNPHIKKYNYIYFNSDITYRMKEQTAAEIFKNLSIDKSKILTMCHHLDLIERSDDGRHLLALAKLPAIKDNNVKIINSHYFGKTTRHEKNRLVKFIVVGCIEQKRKDFNLLLKTVEQLRNIGILNFKIIIMGRTGNIKIKDSIKHIFEFKGRVDYPTMYSEIENADYFLTLLNPDNIEHHRYLTCGTSGSYQLIYGFKKPCIIPRTFANMSLLNEQNALIHTNEDDFADIMQKAINLSNEEYNKIVDELEVLEQKIYNDSLKNLKDIINV